MPNFKALFIVLIIIFALGLLFGPIGLGITLKRYKAKGYWILAREINMNSLSYGAGFVFWSFYMALGSFRSYMVIIGIFFLIIYGVSLGVSLHLYKNAPEEPRV